MGWDNPPLPWRKRRRTRADTPAVQAVSARDRTAAGYGAGLLPAGLAPAGAGTWAGADSGSAV